MEQELEAEWRAYVGLDGPPDGADADLDPVTRAGLYRLASALQGLGVPEAVADLMRSPLRVDLPGAQEVAPEHAFEEAIAASRRLGDWGRPGSWPRCGTGPAG